MEDKLYLNSLLDFYGKLLTERQQNICQLYYREDLSLQEIAEISQISRSAVHDTLKRCRNELEDYESRLKLFASWKTRSKIYEEIRCLTDNEQIHALLDKCIETEND